MVAKSGGSDLYAVGSPRFVAGAVIAHGIGEAIRTQNSFNDCMLASGWVASNTSSPVSNAMNNLSACSAAVYNDPAFAELKAVEPSSPNNATAEQMANSNRATEHEIKLLNERHARILPCRQYALDQLHITSPVMAAAAAEAYAKADRSFKELVDQRISWGEYVARNRLAADGVQARIASNTMAPSPTEPAHASPGAGSSTVTTAKAARATEQFATGSNASDSGPVRMNDQRADPPPAQTPPAIRAMGWEATITKLNGGR